MIDHDIVLYETDASSLTACVVPFIASAVQDHGAAVVIASTEHERAFRETLEELGVDTQSAPMRDRLIFLNANDTIKGLLVDGRIERSRYLRLVANPIMKLAERHTVHAYGELAGMLHSMGRPDAAAQLEHFANEVFSGAPIRFLAGHPHDDFGASISA